MNSSNLLCLSFLFFSLVACSSNTLKDTPTSTSQATKSVMPMGSISKVELGTIVQLKKIIQTNDASLADSGSIGVSVGSGGHSGIYGSINAGNIIRALRKPTKKLEIVIKKNKGGYVSVTQPLGGHFKVGDKIKILLRNGRAVVQH